MKKKVKREKLTKEQKIVNKLNDIIKIIGNHKEMVTIGTLTIQMRNHNCLCFENAVGRNEPLCVAIYENTESAD